jgi:hypothetical protein
MNTMIRRAYFVAIAAIGLVILPATQATAQNTGPRWQAWIGCWTSSIAGQNTVDFKVAPVVCVAPTSNADAVELTTLSDTKVLSRDTIDASGAEHVFTTKNCSTIQTARWSADERRIYFKSVGTCDGLKSTTSSILAIVPSGEWIEVRGLSAGEGSSVRVARYRAVSTPADSLSSANDKTTTAAARIAASAPIGTTAIGEAVKNVDPKVVESWILEGDQRFKLDAKTLVAMADAGIPGNVTDAMIAASNPDAFQVARADRGRNDDDVRGNRIYGGVMTPSSCDPYSRYYDPYDCRYSGDYAYRSRYGYGYGSGYGLGYGYGNGYNNGYYYPPVVIISGTPGADANAKAVKGHGYTQNGSGSSGTASTRDKSSSAPAAKPSNSTNTGSASSSNTGSSSSSSNTTNTNTSTSDRTAHARP